MKRTDAKYHQTHAQLASELNRSWPDAPEKPCEPVISAGGSVPKTDGRSREARLNAGPQGSKRVVHRRYRPRVEMPANYVTIEQSRRPDFLKPGQDAPPAEQPIKEVRNYWND